MTFEFDDFDVRERFFLVEEKAKKLQLLTETLSASDRQFFSNMCLQALIYHDSALDGVVVGNEEIATVFNEENTGYYRRTRVFQEIKNHRNALEKLFLHAEQIKARITAFSASVVNYDEVIAMHGELYAEISKLNPGSLRTNMPVHSMYFHTFVEPKEIENKLMALCEKTTKTDFRAQHPINQAVLFHNEFMEVYPFSYGSGKVARLFLNGFLMQGSYPCLVIHCSERQRYYESLRDGTESFRDLLLDSMDSSLDAQVKFIQEIEDRKPKARVVHVN